jgi:hypothetical protein
MDPRYAGCEPRGRKIAASGDVDSLLLVIRSRIRTADVRQQPEGIHHPNDCQTDRKLSPPREENSVGSRAASTCRLVLVLVRALGSKPGIELHLERGRCNHAKGGRHWEEKTGG